MRTYHQVAEEEFDRDAATYIPADFTQDGFIHTTSPLARVHEIANKHRRGDRRPYILITIDLDRVSAPWRYDAAGTDFPHIYGPLNREAVVDVRPFPRAPDGTFLPLEVERK